MSRKRISRNDPCPCGSGKKYKKCCYGKDFDFEQDGEGNLFKSVPISDEMAELLQEQRQKFIEKHGREPGPDDKVFFDMPHPEHVEHMMVEDMKKAGINPAIIYAFEKTGRLVTEDNQNLLSDADLDEWQAHAPVLPPEGRAARGMQYRDERGGLPFDFADEALAARVNAGIQIVMTAEDGPERLAGLAYVK